MVYDSDFYTTRRPYRSSPAYSSYSSSYEPSRQVRVLPGLGKVHIVHSYDRIVPYVGHKRLTVITSPPKVFSTRPSVLQREYDWIERKVRPWVGYSATNRYLNSDSAVRIVYLPNPATGLSYRLYPNTSYIRNKIYKPLGLYCDYYEPIRSLYWNSSYWPLYRSVSSFVDDLPSQGGTRLQKIFDNETSLIRAQTSALLRKIHDPVPRVQRLSWPVSTSPRYYDVPIPLRYSTDYIYKSLVSSPYNSKVSYTTYYTEPVRKYIGTGRLASVSYAGARAYDRRPHIYLYENPLQSDIQLLSYYINKFKQEKAYSGTDSTKVPLSPARPTRKFGSKNVTEADVKQEEEMRKLREARAARLAFIHEEEKRERVSASREVDEAVKAKKEKEEAARIAEEQALAEEQARQQSLAKEAARKAEIARQEELAAQAAAERAAELERQAEQARREEAKKQAEAERKRQEEEAERARLEEQRRIEEAKAEEALQAQLRLEEIARRAEEEREAELARQAEELAELARQEAELAEQAKREAEDEEQRRQEAELEELRRQEEELAELERQEQELAEAGQQEVEAARAREEAEAARLAAEQAELVRQQAELEELERAQAELDALEAEAKAMESDLGPPPAREEPEQEEDEPQIDEAELARQQELEELRQQEEELAELERAQAELDALEAEAKAMESDLGPPPANYEEDEDDQAIAEDVPGEQSDVEE
ncbi:hypothetical protein ABEB36_002272 [Hypothenemus hampei]|uniref:Uncharacterized protein n=1 Tax=Hypothenemus hampei TaxID=57062 RepID=A0ABD1F550_HYPHA